MQPPAPVIRTIFPELFASLELTGSPGSHGRLPVSARKTRSSTAMERVNNVAAVAPGRATWVDLPLSAGPAGLVSVVAESLGCSEMRVVFGVQLVAPMHVSRTKTWR